MNNHIRFAARQQGAAMIEFAIISPFAILLVLAIVQLGLMFSAKEIVNQAAFLAARAGSVQNAQLQPMTDVMTKALIPFYQDTTDRTDATRLEMAFVASQADTLCPLPPACNLQIEVLNPTPAAFQDFGITSNASQNHVYIPNDNLEYRPHTVIGPNSGLSIQDANALKIKVTYGYPIKVPLMQTVIKAVMCGIESGLAAFNGTSAVVSDLGNCTFYYSRGRIPIVAYATVQMQTPAWQPD